MALKDIAKEVGVSISTVSRVLNKESTSAASEALQKRIWAVAKEQGYLPNRMAQKLRNAEPDESGFLRQLYCLHACPPMETKDDPFYTKLMDYIEREALKHNYTMQYVFNAQELDGGALPYHYAVPGLYDGLIILGRFDAALLEAARRDFKKIIYIGLNRLPLSCDQIVCNGYDIAQAVVRNFYSMGHRAIGYVGAMEARYHGFLRGMEKLGLEANPHAVINDIPLSLNGGYRGMLRLIDEAPDTTAVFCANDITAIGALRACKIRGVSVPEDISLIGVNDIENVQYTEPMLSTVRVPLEEMGKMAVTLLLNRVEGGHSCPVVVEFPFQLIHRESCRKLD